MDLKHTIAGFGLAFSLAFLTACNSSGGDGSGSTGGSNSSSDDSASANPDNTTGDTLGRVADGYLVGATVCLDVNESFTCDMGEPTTLSEDGGTFELDATDEQLAESRIIVVVGPDTIDEDTGEAVGRSYTLTSPVENKAFVSPLTTMLQAAVENDPGASVAEKKRQVAMQLGLDPDSDLLYQDYVMESPSDDGMRSAYALGQLTARVLGLAEAGFKTTYEAETGSAPSPAAARAFGMVLQDALNEQLPALRNWVDSSARTLSEIETQASAVYNGFEFMSDAKRLVAMVHASEHKVKAQTSPVKDLFEVGYGTLSGMYMDDSKCFSGDLNRIKMNQDGLVVATHYGYDRVQSPNQSTRIESTITDYPYAGTTVGDYFDKNGMDETFSKTSFDYGFMDDGSLRYTRTVYDGSDQVIYTETESLNPRFFRQDISNTPVYEWLVLSDAQQGFMDNFNASGLTFPEGSEIFYVTLGVDGGPGYQWFEGSELTHDADSTLTDLASHQSVNFTLTYMEDDAPKSIQINFSPVLEGEYGDVSVRVSGDTRSGSYRFGQYEGESAFVIDPAFARSAGLPFYVFGTDTNTSDQDANPAVWMATDKAYVKGAEMHALYAVNYTAYDYLWQQIDQQRADCSL
ncbi:hypothetical protein [Saccharospirillum salsuginis]|uniref:Uncharacterized protein n=1 Tax=Saccharospirillum salsuginis TaxID=418750 RepID=A0A918N9A8_9GAMM|nr:hypothetical protein [Saccharospirillum salsuginis]GGX50624.1 hypothetical protein GCM10007392_17240 [Saccharospirillum salsuginis]